MVKLPDYRSLGEPGGFRQTRSVVSADASGIGRAAARLGGAVAGIGADVQKEQDAMDVMRADVRRKELMLEHERTYENDPDYGKYGQRFDVASKAITEDSAKLIGNQKLREKFKLQSQEQAAGVKDRIVEKGIRLQKEAKVAEVEGILDKHYNRYIDPNTSPEQKEQARRDIDTNITLSEQAGLITPGAATTMRRKFSNKLAVDEVETRIMADPGSMLKDLEDLGKFGINEIPAALVSGTAKAPAHGWAARNETWLKLSPFQKAAAMALMEADKMDMADARNALGAMINRAAKNGEDLGLHVSQKIYQPTMEAAQEKRLGSILRSDQFEKLTSWAERRARGIEADPVNGATHFLAHEKTMLDLEARDPRKYKSWRQWTGYDNKVGAYRGVISRDKSHAFLAPDGVYSHETAPANDSEIKVASLGSPEEELRKRDLVSRYGVLDPKQRLELKAKAERQIKVNLEEHRQEWKDMMADDIASIRTTGVGREDIDLTNAEKVLTKNQLRTYKTERAKAQQFYDATKDVNDLTDDQMRERLIDLTPEPGSEGYADKQEVLRDVKKKMDDLKEKRRKDPASTVDASPEVAAAVRRAAAAKAAPNAVTGGTVDVSGLMGADMAAVIQARLDAQEARGIANPRTITKAEAMTVLPDLKESDPKKLMASLKAAALRADQIYGKYGERVFRDALVFAKPSKEANDLAIGALTKVIRGGDLTRRDINAMQMYEGVTYSDAWMNPDAQTFQPTRMEPGSPALSQATAMTAADTASYASQAAALGPNQAQVDWASQDPAKRGPVLDKMFGAGTWARIQSSQTKK